MIVLKKKLTIEAKQNRLHINIPFQIPSEGKKLYINFSYKPHRYNDKERCIPMLRKALAHYAPEKSYTDEDLLRYLPLKNLVTVSLDSPSGAVGSAHRHNDNQKHIISEVESSRGFIKQKIIQGDWNITLSVHSIVSPQIDVELEVSYE